MKRIVVLETSAPWNSMEFVSSVSVLGDGVTLGRRFAWFLAAESINTQVNVG